MDSTSGTDSSWRVGAIFRCCVRYGKDRQWAERKLEDCIGQFSADRLADIWFRKQPIFASREAAAAFAMRHPHSRRPDIPPVGYRNSVIENAREDYLAYKAAAEPQVEAEIVPGF